MNERRGVVVACADRLFAEVTAAWLDRSEAWRSVGIAADGLQALGMTTRSDADRLLVIGELPRLPAVALTKQVRRRSPHVGLVVLGTVDVAEARVVDPHAGAETVLDALAWEAPTSSTVTFAAPEGLSRLRSLTPRERAVLRMLTQGATRDEIASRLGVSRNTVRTHMQNLYAKLDLHSRVDILKFGAQHGLVSSDRSPRDLEAP
jgi:DNA-binding NarL/FixJ family response regulator